MVGLSDLLKLARDAGLTWHQDGNRLVVRGPRAAAELAKQLIGRKAEVFASIARQPESPPACYCCRGRRWWRSVYGPHLICGICHPPAFANVVAEWIEPFSRRTAGQRLESLRDRGSSE